MKPDLYLYGQFLILLHRDKRIARETGSGFIPLGLCYHELLI